MGRLIDADKYMRRLRAEIDCEVDIIAKYIKEDTPIGTVKDCGRIGRLQGVQWCRNTLELDCYTVEAIPKDQYETRLKADMVAMLTEIQLEIEELDPSGNEWSDSLDACNDIIQQKINSLKAESEDNKC